MKEELISFETAKLANKAGFNWPSEHRYNKKGTFNYSKAWSISAPTQSLLQRWLREEHDIHILMNITVKGNYSCNIYIQGSKELVKKADVRSDNKEGYEEVLEIAFQEALKLIGR